MPCRLMPGQSANADWEAPAGTTVHLSVRADGDDPQALELDFIRYDGATIRSDPAEIIVASGRKPLVVGLRGLSGGARGWLIETGQAGAERRLRRLRYSPLDPARDYIVEGK